LTIEIKIHDFGYEGIHFNATYQNHKTYPSVQKRALTQDERKTIIKSEKVAPSIIFKLKKQPGAWRLCFSV